MKIDLSQLAHAKHEVLSPVSQLTPVGEKVICIDADSTHLKLYGVYTISANYSSYIDLEGYGRGFWQSRFIEMRPRSIDVLLSDLFTSNNSRLLDGLYESKDFYVLYCRLNGNQLCWTIFFDKEGNLIGVPDNRNIIVRYIGRFNLKLILK